MKRTKRILLSVGCVALLIASWTAAITAKSDADKQRELIDQAAAYTADEIYILAVPPLEEAASYQDTYTLEAETDLKRVYLHLAGKDDYERRYRDLLDKQMARKGASPEIFREAAVYYLERGKTSEALAALRDGIEKTQDEDLRRYYEDNRYEYRMSRDFYEEAGAIHQGAAAVKKEGRWGLADAMGSLVISCLYDRISTFDGDRAIVELDGVLSAVDQDNNRVALLHEKAEDFGNFAENRLGVKKEDGWHLATGTFTVGSTAFQELGMFSNGCIPAKLDGRWGLLESDGGTWRLEPRYEEILQDELGRYGNLECLFVRRGAAVYLLAGKDYEEIGGPYEDAQPFAGSWAAVRKGEKWGFIDAEGVEQIPCQFEDALSFGGHLAAVQQDGLWGYVSLLGEVVIEPQFLEAKSFSDGSAPVRTELGWQFITLLEYESEGGGLF